MRNLRYLLATVLIYSLQPASADLISPEVAAAWKRLNANPDTYDQVDNFCNGKKRGESCSIPGTTFSGGGMGICRNAVNDNGSSINMSCVRNGEVWIDRKLPDGGFVINDPYLCQSDRNRDTARKWNCTPMVPTPSDLFCKGKSIGDRCTVELRYQGNHEQHEGICNQIVETENFYYQGRRTATRQVILCEPPALVQRSYAPASWWQKLTQ